MTLDWTPAADRPDLLAEPVAKAVASLGGIDRGVDPGGEGLGGVRVAEIDPDLADTAAFCERYGWPMADGANCVVVAGKRGGQTTYAACLVLGSMKIDVNGVVRRHLDVRKLSFAPMAEAVELTGMEYGGITPLGLPPEWRILVDSAVAAHPRLVVGSGLRRSKLSVPGETLAQLPNAEVLTLAG